MKTEPRVEGKHTPGPWFVADCWYIYGNLNSNTKDHPRIAKISRPKELHQRAANARLIEASPDLLEVARLYNDRGYGSNVQRDKLRAAIAKAEGVYDEK